MLLYSRFFFFECFRFLSRCSRLRQSLFLLMRTTQISKAVLSTMMLISRRRQSGLRHRRMNRLRVWVYPRDQRWFGDTHRNPAMHGFFREHFRMSFDSFQALCRILSPFMAVTWIFPLYDTIGENDRSKPFPQTRNTPKYYVLL